MESVYSMDGDIGDLPAARKFSDKFGAFLIVDEAHGLGTIGKTGRGIEEHYDYKYSADLICGSLTKSIGSQGGFICCSEGLRTQFTFKANGSIFSAPISAFNTGAGIKALEIMEREPERVERLQKTAVYMREQFRANGFEIGDACTCVVPVIFKDIYKTLHMHKWLLSKHNIFSSMVMAPACPIEAPRFRICATADMTIKEVDELIYALKDARDNCPESDRMKELLEVL